MLKTAQNLKKLSYAWLRYFNMIHFFAVLI